MRTTSLANAKQQLSALVEEIVTTHERITVTRHGAPAVVLMAAEDLESLQETLELLADPAGRQRLERAQAEVAAGNLTSRDEMATLMAERRSRAGRPA